MQIISKVALISINETLFVQLVSFLIFLFLINRIMLRPLKSSMDERGNYLVGLGEEIRNTRKDMEDILSQLKKQESAVRNEAEGIRTELEVQGQQKAAEIHNDFQANALKLRQQTEKEIETQMAEARKQLKKESEVLAISIMEKVLNRRLAS